MILDRRSNSKCEFILCSVSRVACSEVPYICDILVPTYASTSTSTSTSYEYVPTYEYVSLGIERVR